MLLINSNFELLLKSVWFSYCKVLVCGHHERVSRAGSTHPRKSSLRKYKKKTHWIKSCHRSLPLDLLWIVIQILRWQCLCLIYYCHIHPSIYNVTMIGYSISATRIHHFTKFFFFHFNIQTLQCYYMLRYFIISVCMFIYFFRTYQFFAYT